MKVNFSNLLVLKDNQTIDILQLNGGFISNIANIDAQIITIPNQSGNIYFISNDNKIKLYNQIEETIETVLENRGINIDEQNLYIYNNRAINAYQSCIIYARPLGSSCLTIEAFFIQRMELLYSFEYLF